MTGPAGIDPRGPRFTASVTLVVLAAALLLAEPAPAVAGVLVALQVAMFAVGVGLGVHRTPTGLVFRTLIRPRLTPPEHLEDPAPPRFAQAIGLAFAVTALVALLADALLLAQVALGMAVVAAFLNAVFALCLGCELYLLGLRLTRRTA